jgi:hypothetical protein
MQPMQKQQPAHKRIANKAVEDDLTWFALPRNPGDDLFQSVAMHVQKRADHLDGRSTHHRVAVLGDRGDQLLDPLHALLKAGVVHV